MAGREGNSQDQQALSLITCRGKIVKIFITAPSLIIFVMALFASTAWAQTNASPRIAVTHLAYTQEVSQYFQVAKVGGSSTLNTNTHGFATTSNETGTYAAGSYSHINQYELGSFTNDIRGALLKGTAFRLVQGRAFVSGDPQATKAEQILNQIKTGKMALPKRQPEIKDIVARIKKGEFNGADYVLFGTLSSIEFRDELSPLQGTTNGSYLFSLDLVADFSLISTKTFEIKAAFSAQGAGSDIKLLSIRGDIVRPNRGGVMRETSQTLAVSVYDQLVEQLGLSDPNMAREIRGATVPSRTIEAHMGQPAAQEQVTILK